MLTNAGLRVATSHAESRLCFATILSAGGPEAPPDRAAFSGCKEDIPHALAILPFLHRSSFFSFFD